MLLVAGLLIYLGIARKMEPLLLVPIGFGVLLVNLPLGGLMEVGADGEPVGLLALVFRGGITTELVPAFIFLGLGAMYDFGPVIANPKTIILGAGAQFGVFVAFIIALLIGQAFPNLLDIGINEAAAIGIIGGADGPTAIFTATELAPKLVGVIAVSAYTYMALVPIILPPVIRLLTTKEERAIYMKPQLRKVSKREKLLFPIIGAAFIILLVPRSAPLIGMFMFGNLLVVSGVTERLAETAANAFMNILTILLGLSIGAFMSAENFLQGESLVILGLGVIAFAASAAAGILLAKFMNLFIKSKISSGLKKEVGEKVAAVRSTLQGTDLEAVKKASQELFNTVQKVGEVTIEYRKEAEIRDTANTLISAAEKMLRDNENKINPMIGAAGLSAVPMAARVVQVMGLKANRRNHLLMHAMGPNIAGVIGTATVAGVFLGILG
jgi:oxaloacetate decarboxylase beta subunit